MAKTKVKHLESLLKPALMCPFGKSVVDFDWAASPAKWGCSVKTHYAEDTYPCCTSSHYKRCRFYKDELDYLKQRDP